MRRTHALTLVVAASTSACGRLGFDAFGAGDGGGDGPITPVDPSVTVVTPVGSGASSSANSLALHGDGGIAVAGEFAGGIQLAGRAASAAGNADLFVAVLEADGQLRWMETGGSDGYASIRNVMWVGDALFAGGYFSSDLPNVFADTSDAGQDALLVRFRSAGGVDAAYHWGGTTNCQLRGLASSSTRMAKVGLYADPVNFGDGPLADPGGNDNGWITVSDLDQEQVSSRSLITDGDVFPNDVAVGADGSICVTGRFQDQVDFGEGTVVSPFNNNSGFLAKYDADLDLVWALPLGPGANGTNVTILPDGDCVVIGTFYDTLMSPSGAELTSAGDSDAYVGRFASATGARRWMRNYGGPGTDSGLHVEVAGSELIIAGLFSSAAQLPGGTRTSDGSTDGFIAAISDAGDGLWVQTIGGTGEMHDSAGNVSVDLVNRRVGFAFAFDGQLSYAGTTMTAIGSTENGAFVVTTLDP